MCSSRAINWRSVIDQIQPRDGATNQVPVDDVVEVAVGQRVQHLPDVVAGHGLAVNETRSRAFDHFIAEIGPFHAAKKTSDHSLEELLNFT